MKRTSVPCLEAATVLLVAALAALSPVNAASPQGAADRGTTVREIERLIDETYVFPALRPRIRAQLERSRHAHRYDVSDPGLFVTRINEDLEAAAHDGHLYLTDDREQYAAMLAPPQSIEGLDAYRRALAVQIGRAHV